MRGSKRIALVVLLASLFAGHFIYWRLAAGELRDKFESWAVGARSSGWDIRYSAITVGGWPSAATVRVANLTMRTTAVSSLGDDLFRPLHLDTLSLGSDAVLISAKLTSPGVLEVTPSGVCAVRMNDGAAIPVSADQMTIRLTSHLNALPWAVDLDAVALAIEFPGVGMIRVGNLAGHAALVSGAARDQAAAIFSISAHALILPDGRHWQPGPEISEFALDGALKGAIPPGGIQGGQGLTAQAASWRDAGGSLELRRLAVNWGPARLTATARLTLDEDLQPMGTGTGEIVDPEEALDALAADALLNRATAGTIEAALSRSSNTLADGGRAPVEAPLTLRYRTLSMRQLPLARLPELDWSRPGSARTGH